MKLSPVTSLVYIMRQSGVHGRLTEGSVERTESGGLNVYDEDGAWTLLHFLTAFPDTKPSMEVLLEFKANINARDKFFDLTPLTWAVVQRRLDRRHSRHQTRTGPGTR